MDPLLSSAEPEEITLTMPKSTLDIARQFVKAFGQALDAADATVKASQKSAKADEALGAMLNPQDPMAGFAQEMTQASNRGMGL